MKVRLGIGIVVAAAALAVSACGSDSSSDDTSSNDVVNVGVAQLTAQNDDSFGESTHEGILKVEEELGVNVTELNNLFTPEQQLSAIQNLARSNDLVLMVAMSPQELPSKFPDTHFSLTDGSLPPAENTSSVHQDWHGVAFLAGVVAAEQTTTGTIGAVAGPLIPPVKEGLEGLEAGAKSVDPSIKMLDTSTGSFTDVAKAKAAASAQIAEGVDVIFSFVDAGHAGVVQAIEESGKPVKLIGSVAPKCSISDGLDIGDATFDQVPIVSDLIKEFQETGTLPEQTTYSLENGYSEFKFCPGASAELKEKVADTADAIASGEIDPEAE